MQKTYVQMSDQRARSLPALKGATAAYADAVRIDLGECALLYISGKVGTDENSVVAYGDMRAQTRQTLENIEATIKGQGGTMSDVVRFRIFVSTIDSQAVREIHDARRESSRKVNSPPAP